MKLTFNIRYFIAFVLLLICEVCIALFLVDGFIRYTIGDFLVVIMIYCFIKSFIKTHSIYIAIFTLLFAFGIEFLQLTNMVRYDMLKEYKWVSIVLGSHFSITDLIAYSLGTISVLYLDTYISHLKSQHHETTY